MGKGFEQAKAKADELKKEATEKKEIVKEEVEKTLAVVRANSDLAKAYQEAAKMGADNLGGSSPMLKVHSTGKSQSNELADGTEPNNGWFFYGPTAEQFKEVECHILSISRGYRAIPLNQKPGQKNQFNQLITGVILNEGRMLAFISYITGVKLSKMWEFGKEAAKYTRAKPISIPLFALRVKLTTGQVDSNFGKQWAINFEIMKNEDGSPVVVTDMGEFTFLKNMVEQMEEVMDAIISRKAVEDEEVLPAATVVERGLGGAGEGGVEGGGEPGGMPF